MRSIRHDEGPKRTRARGRELGPRTRTIDVVIAVLIVTPLLCVYLPPFAELLHLQTFPVQWWLAVAAAATVPLWLEPLKSGTGRLSSVCASA